jgi:hypothetical protein
VLGDREAAEIGLEILAWVAASAEGDPEAARAVAPRGLDEQQGQRWGGIAVLALLGLYRRGIDEPELTVEQAMSDLRADWLAFRDDPPDTRGRPAR